MNYFSYPETESILKKAGDKITVSMHLDSIPAGVRYHNGCNTFDNGVIVGWHVNAEQPMPVYHSVILIDAFGCSTIAHIVLCTSCNFFTTNTNKNKLIDPSYNIYACINKQITKLLKMSLIRVQIFLQRSFNRTLSFVLRHPINYNLTIQKEGNLNPSYI